MATTVTFLEQEGQEPAAVAHLLADFLAGARNSLHVAIYDFRLSAPLAAPVVGALRDRAAAGVDVRIVYDAGKPASDPWRASGDPAPPGTADFVRHLGAGIVARAITGGPLPTPRLMHHKYVVRDGHTTAATLWTGSTNFTDDSWAFQENNILQVASPELCAYYENDFDELWQRGDIGTSGEQDRGTVRVEAATVTVAFAPGEGPAIDHEIAQAIGLARGRLKICSMLLTSGAILGALGDLRHHGRVAEYSGIYDRTQMASVFEQWQATPRAWKIAAFEQAAAGLVGKQSTPYTPGSRHDFMHNKVLVCDDLVVTGSYNLSHSATQNAENVLLVQDPALADQYAAYIDRLAARYARGAGNSKFQAPNSKP